MELERKKKLVAIAYMTVFTIMFVLAAAVSINRKIEDARSARDAALVGSGSSTAPVASR